MTCSKKGKVILASTWHKTSERQMFQVPCQTCCTLIIFSIYCKYRNRSLNVSVSEEEEIIGKTQTGLTFCYFYRKKCLSGLIKNETSEFLDSVTHVITMLSLILKRSRKTKCSNQEYWKNFSSEVLTVLKNKGAKVSGFYRVSVSISATYKMKLPNLQYFVFFFFPKLYHLTIFFPILKVVFKRN